MLRYTLLCQALSTNGVVTHHCDILETGNDSFRFKQRKKGMKSD